MKIALLVTAAAALAAFGGCGPSNTQAAYPQYVSLDKIPSESALQSQREKALPKLTEQSAVSDYLTYAAMNNPGLEAAFERFKAALEAIPQARALPDPQFTFRYFVVAQAMRDGDMRFSYELSQTFPWFGKLQLKGDMAAQDAQAAYRRLEAQRLELFSRVKEAYSEYYYISRATAITRDNLDRLQSIERIARAKYANVTGAQPDLLRVQVEVGKLENELASLEDMRSPVAAKLNAALNRPSDAPLPKTVAPMPVSNFEADERLIAWMEQSNPELRAIESDIERERLGIDLAMKDYYPDLMLGVEYDQMTRASGIDMSPENPIAVMVSVNLPIWWNKYAAGVRQARARHSAARKDKADKINTLSATLKTESYNLRNAQRKVALYRDTLLPRAQASMKSTLSSYQTGTAAFADLIDAQRILLEFELDAERASADRQQALARLEAIVGRPATASQPASAPATASSQP